jgi:alkylhydroperoxidase family enzyme
MLEYAMKLTHDPGGMCEADIERLRTAGLSDMAIHDLAQVVGLFNYYNRLADGLGIAIDEFAHPESADQLDSTR